MYLQLTQEFNHQYPNKCNNLIMGWKTLATDIMIVANWKKNDRTMGTFKKADTLLQTLMAENEAITDGQYCYFDFIYFNCCLGERRNSLILLHSYIHFVLFSEEKEIMAFFYLPHVFDDGLIKARKIDLCRPEICDLFIVHVQVRSFFYYPTQS